MYAAIATRPDIAFAVNSLAQYNQRPSTNHWDAVIRIFRYLRKTKNLGILYDNCENNFEVEESGFTDAGNGTNMTAGLP